ncbi:MAG TPA: biotin--[acetyl-CoA-carboxylase] ligase, partial [Flavisolibacter sp.]|nr:biotin--[acetyl-CoA-carboxylase] ligase [Flavisolibacter sp.]
VHEGMAQHGTAVFTHDQTKGKGQRNKQWLSEPRLNVALSVIIKPRLAISQFFQLSMMVAVAVHKVFSKCASEETKIKWPNDIYWRDRKAGGILIENVVSGTEWKWAVAGIGLNINQVHFSEMQNRPVSLKQITGKEFEPLDIAKQICNGIDQDLKVLYNAPAIIVSTYKQSLYKLNDRVKLKHQNRVIEAIVKDVTPHGELVVQHTIEEYFKVGEVEWV